jgi:hypothetical protein
MAHSSTDQLNALVAGLPSDVASPEWTDDPFYWTFFVPPEVRSEWEQLSAREKAVVYATAIRASRYLHESGAFDG